MELEQVFSRPATLTKLRSGPLGSLLDGYCAWLLKRGFSRHTIWTLLEHISHLNEYLSRQKVAAGHHLCSTEIAEFHESYPSWCQCRGPLEAHLVRVRYSVNRFVEYLIAMELFDQLPQHEIHQPLLDAYLAWMASHQYAAAETLEHRAKYLITFLRWLGPKATSQSLASLTQDDVEKFFLAYAQKVGGAARQSMQAALRTFFRFCLYQGNIHAPLDFAVPSLRTYRLTSVPHGLQDAEAQRVLQGINRKTLVGRRDYAILQLLYTYGVRGGQVRALRLEQIDWARNQILFEPSKRGKASLLPLTPEVGESLLDYLQNSRYPSQYPQVFLTMHAPYQPLLRANALTAIVERKIRAVGIETPSKGSHVFRHAFATRMLQKGHPLKAIADVLGHRCLRTTSIYAKVDFNSLRQVPLDWPEEVPL